MKKTIVSLLYVVIVVAIVFFVWQSQKQGADSSLQQEQGIEQNAAASEQEFNNSGRAKAIEDEADLWMFYEDESAGFSIKYPHDVVFDEDHDDSVLRLIVRSEPIETLEYTIGFDRETALKNREALLRGEYGPGVDWPLDASKNVISVGPYNAQEFMVLARFEVCDVTLERTLYLLTDTHQVRVIVGGPEKAIQQGMPQYFKTDPDNCGAETIWDLEKRGQFYGDLVNGDGSEEAQRWFDVFDQIIGTIEFDRAE
jgi:hypothetical protein